MATKLITIDVTGLTSTRRKEIFECHFNQNGFKEFNKHTSDDKTTYNFYYQN